MQAAVDEWYEWYEDSPEAQSLSETRTRVREACEKHESKGV